MPATEVIQKLRDALLVCRPVVIEGTVYWERDFVLAVLDVLEKEL